MKNTLLILSICASNLLYSQKLICRNGITTFEASMPAFEEIKAQNNASTFVLNTNNGEVASVIQMLGFKFKSALMEEHFNENYVESSKFPKSTFKGIITNFKEVKEKGGNANIEGILEIHGVKKKINMISELKKNGNIYQLIGSFKVSPKDFSIDIPSIVKNKIAKEIIINFNYNLK